MPQLGNDLLKYYGGQITLLYEDNGIKDFWFPTKMAMFCLKCSYLPTNLLNIPFKPTFKLSRLGDNIERLGKDLDLYALLFIAISI
jgi:hypothetical protein